MNFSTRDIQARCAALGFWPGPIDGIWGPRTREAVQAALEHHGGRQPSSLFHPSGLHRIHLHWTGGADGVIRMERTAYNGLVARDGERVMGQFPFEAQADYAVGRAASHTLNANPGAIGLSADAMAGAKERPFNPGSAPMTVRQLDEICRWSAELSVRYWIPVRRFSILTHAEVQPTLGIRQRWKWDITWLPGMSDPGDPVAVGDRLREMISDHLPDVRAAA